MGPDEQFESPLEVGQEDNVAPQRFSSPNEILAWMNEQSAFYSQLVGKQTGIDQAAQTAWSSINSLLQDGVKRFNQLKATPATADQYEKLLKRYTGYYKSKKLFDQKSPVGLFLQELSTKEPALAALVAVILLNVPVPFQSAQSSLWLEAGAIAVGWNRGWLETLPAESQSLEEFRLTWERRFKAVETDTLQTKSAVEKEAEEIKTRTTAAENALSNLAKQAQVLNEELSSKTAEAIANCSSQITDFTSAYNQALSLRAPTNYWKAKQTGHRLAAGLWFAAFIVSAVITVIGVWYVWHETVEIHLGAGMLNYTAFIPSIGAALLGAWFLRLFSRQIISNLALSADAGERVSMVKTYLALTEGGHAQESDRGLILSSLFRSASKVSDDGSPPTIADIVGKVLRSEK